MSAYDVLITPGPVSGSVLVPPSKSLGHRALICAALAKGTSHIYHLGDSQDMQATMQCLQAMGAGIEQEANMTKVTGADFDSLPAAITLDAHESGSTLRFLIPPAACTGRQVTFEGKPSLLTRPMGVYADIFAAQNLPFDQSGEAIRFHGPLLGGLYSINGNVSSQFISGLLFAGPLLGGIEIAVLPPYESRSYVDLTLEMMCRFGVHVEQPTDHAYRISPDQHYQPARVIVDSDWSQAAFFLALGMLNAPLELCGLNPASRQGDAVIASIVEQAGGKLTWKDDVLYVEPDKRLPFEADLANCPDLGPILCALAALIPGTSRLTNIARLRYKECDRVAAMEEELKKWGVNITSDENTITIQGQAHYEKPEVVVLDGHNDHRVVMAMAIFGLCASSPCQISNAQAVNKSYPHFFEDLLKIHAKVECL